MKCAIYFFFVSLSKTWKSKARTTMQPMHKARSCRSQLPYRRSVYSTVSNRPSDDYSNHTGPTLCISVSTLPMCVAPLCHLASSGRSMRGCGPGRKKNPIQPTSGPSLSIVISVHYKTFEGGNLCMAGWLLDFNIVFG